MHSSGILLGRMIWFACLLLFLFAFRREVDQGPALLFAAEKRSGSNPDRKQAFLDSLLQSHPSYFKQILAEREEFRVQIIYTQIDRKADNQPLFTDYFFNVDTGLYFYPASTVKMPVALLALQRLNELNIQGLASGSTLLTGAGYSGQDPVWNDPTTPEGRPSVANYIRKIFLVSDNDAYNRLYEFLGMDYINEQLHKKGYVSSQIRHRLERALTDDENRHTNPVQFIDSAGRILFDQPLQHSNRNFSPRHDFLGKAHYSRGKLQEGPFNFSEKNRLALEDLHTMLKAVLFPEAVPAIKRFGLTTKDYQLVRKCMGQYPRESLFPGYDPDDYEDAYCKFIYWGGEKGRLPGDLRIFNKVGDAYGFLLDVAYVADFTRKIEFMVSAVIYCNGDGIINDSQYDYEAVGYPFMKNLGRVLYAHERTRKRQRVPDLSAFRFAFQK